MDLKNHLRFYQDENQSVKEIFEELCSTYVSSGFLMDYQQEDSLQEFTIQYLEEKPIRLETPIQTEEMEQQALGMIPTGKSEDSSVSMALGMLVQH